MNFTNPKVGQLPYLVEYLQERIVELEQTIALLQERIAYIETLMSGDGK